MSRTRNQRRRDRDAEKILIAVLTVVLLFLLSMLFEQWSEIEKLQEKRRERESQQVTVWRASDFLPDNFDPSCPEYQAALQRYNEENGLILPDEKETAPEAGTSEAEDARDIAS